LPPASGKKIWHTDGPSPLTLDSIVYLEEYDREIDTPPTPTLQDVKDQIRISKDTSPGPNGVPFGAYRALLDRGTAVDPSSILFQVLQSLGTTQTPPPEFNMANLSLFPKDDTDYIGSGRPLSVNNTDNRLIASTIRACVHDPIKDFLHPEQHGFLKGKDIRDNIKFFNDKFYTACEAKTHYSLFLFDFQKAFDSVSHEFIISVLEKIKMPVWMVNTVRNLLFDATLNVNQFGDFGFAIKVQRGVKQGCPLSPLLFNLVMDVLLHHLLSLPNPPDVAAYADDLGLGFTDPAQYAAAAEVMHMFGEASGLKLNQKKTKLLLAKDEDPKVINCYLKLTRWWSKIPICDSGVYLGVLFGRSVDLYNIYKESYDKFQNRLRALIAIRHRYTIAKRVIICNVFVFSIFSYLHNFFCIPPGYYNLISQNLSVYLTPFQGAYKWTLLTNPKGFFALKTPLACLHSRAHAALASQTVSTVNPGAVDTETLNESFRIKVHIQAAVSHVFKTATVIPKKDQWTAANLYKSIMHSHQLRCSSEHLVWRKIRNWRVWAPVGQEVDTDVDRDSDSGDNLDTDNTHGMALRHSTQRSTHTSIARASDRHNQADTAAAAEKRIDTRLDIAQNNYRAITRQLPDYIHYYQLAILYNAHTTATRVEWSRHQSGRGEHQEPHVRPGELCGLCHAGVDGLKHLFVFCTTVQAAEIQVAHNHFTGWPAATLERMLLLPNFSSSRDVNLLVVFHTAVLQVRKQRRSGYHVGSTDLAGIISKVFEGLKSLYLKSLFPDPRSVVSGGARGAGGNSGPGVITEKRRLGAITAHRIINGAGPDVTLAFTDGSHITETNRTGAGFIIYRGDSVLSRIALSLLDSTNNEAELFAIGACSDKLLMLCKSGVILAGSLILIFTDSEYCFDIVNGDSIPAMNIHIAHHTIAKFNSLCRFHPNTSLHWLPSHMGDEAIVGNEDADFLAKQGVLLWTVGTNSSAMQRVRDNPDDFTSNSHTHPLRMRAGME
jgi:ribonuclease HI